MNQFRIQLERERMLYIQAKDLSQLYERLRKVEEERTLYIQAKDLNQFHDRLRKMEDRASNLDGRFWALGVGLTILTTLMNLAMRFWTP
jgi:hypothetical protein